MKFLAAILAIFFTLAAQGAFFSNLGNDATGFPATVNTTQWAIGFTVTGSEPVDLSKIAISATPLSAGSIVLEVRANTLENNPEAGSPLISLTGPLESAGQGGFSTYTFDANLTLDGEETYWVVFNRNGASTYDVPERGAYSGSTGASYFGTRYFFAGTWQNGDGSFLSLELTPVPEPAHSGAIAATFLVVCALGRACWSRRLLSKARALFR